MCNKIYIEITQKLIVMKECKHIVMYINAFGVANELSYVT